MYLTKVLRNDRIKVQRKGKRGIKNEKQRGIM